MSHSERPTYVRFLRAESAPRSPEWSFKLKTLLVENSQNLCGDFPQQNGARIFLTGDFHAADETDIRKIAEA
jgi:hypothetical protein